MSLEEDRLREIKEIILMHKGKENAIPANKIGRALNIPENDTVSTTRKLITKLIKRDKMPIGASEKGYYIILTEEELNDSTRYLNDRIYGIYDRINRIISNFNGAYGKSVKRVGVLEEEDSEI